MVIAAIGVALWFVHAVRICIGRRSTGWLLAWLIGIPLLCGLDYVVFATAVFHPDSGGISDQHPLADQMVLNLFVGLGVWVVLLALEPVLLLVDAVVAHRRRVPVTR